jgi:SAM-dependent methyltransferase
MSASPAAPTWQEVEFGAYDADLALWEELAAADRNTVLDVGCGAGRVLVHLARCGRSVTGIDADPAMVAVANERSRLAGLVETATAVHADAREFDLGARFALAIAPMQTVQLVGGPSDRARMLERIAAHLEPGGLAAFALVARDGVTYGAAGGGAAAPIPDVRERDGWIYSSLPLSIRDGGGALVIERLRQTVSPDGDLSEELHVERLEPMDAATLEAEARRVGLRPLERRSISATAAHVGSDVVVAELS